MARVGFKKTYAPGTFDETAAAALFALIKSYVASAGFNVLLDTSDTIDFIRAGSPAGTADDDVPHWAFQYVADINWLLHAYAVFGNDVLDAGALKSEVTVAHGSWIAGYPDNAHTVWFAADGVAGWWWIHCGRVDAASPTGYAGVAFRYAGISSRRYPSDYYQGLCARYGIHDTWGYWYPAYAVNAYDGSVNGWPYTMGWCPFGFPDYYASHRHPGSPLPRMAVPYFPSNEGDNSAAILGEFDALMVVTDGYAQEETVMPGWMAVVGGEWDYPFAVPRPVVFDAP